jgi:hypothetical protein
MPGRYPSPTTPFAIALTVARTDRWLEVDTKDTHR